MKELTKDFGKLWMKKIQNDSNNFAGEEGNNLIEYDHLGDQAE